MMPTKEERQWRNDVIDTIDKIIEVRPHVHKIRLSADWYNWNQSMPCDLVWRQNDRDQKYQQVAFAKNEYGTFRFERAPEFPYYPPLFISTTATNIKSLHWLCKSFPNLRVSSIELAIDFIANENNSVSDIFFMLHHYIYFPRYTGEIEIIGGNFDGWKDYESENRVFKAYNKKKKNNRKKNNKKIQFNSAKIYERGPDEKSIKKQDGKPCWRHEDLDRVRLEVRLRNIGENSKLKKLNIHLLGDLLLNFRPEKLFPSLFRLSCFTGKGFLKEYEEYYDKDMNKILSFQELYIRYKEEKKHPASRIKKAKHTRRLEDMISKALKDYSQKRTAENWAAGFTPSWREIYDMS